jgi:UDP-GlcNAc:undecaprenyl-phosphate/decaprenyl-phosphate GlcNAc-1-phosphate transferase
MTMFHWALLGAGLASFLIVRFAALHLRITGDRPARGPQKFHARPVPRIGGVAVLAGLVVAGLASAVRGQDSAVFHWLMLGALVPAFAGGLAEDLTRRVGPAPRLLMTVVSAAIAFVWLDAQLYRSDIAWLDAAFAYWPISLAATLFAVAGMAHAMNIIDGYNGLSAGVGILALVGLAIVAASIDDMALARFALAAAGAWFGFLVLNYPSGKLFQGDSGAYLLGTIIAVLSAQLVGRHTEISPWFPFALVVYPVWETLFSMLRRAMAHTPIGAPDAQHLHSLIHQVLMPQLLPGRDARSLVLRNAFTSIPLWVMQLGMVAMAVAWHDSTQLLMLQCYGFVAWYCVAYIAVAMADRRRRARMDAAGEPRRA